MPVMAHIPDRPTWDCAACGDEWPCEAARNELIEEYRYSLPELRIYLGEMLMEAVGDIATHEGFTSGGAFERFLAWAQPPELHNFPRLGRLRAI